MNQGQNSSKVQPQAQVVSVLDFEARYGKTVITAETFERGASINGGFSHKQLRLLGVEIPLKKGWKSRLIGTFAPIEAVDQFIALKDVHLKGQKKLT